MNPDDPAKPIIAQVFKTWVPDGWVFFAQVWGLKCLSVNRKKGQQGLTACWYFRPEQVSISKIIRSPVFTRHHLHRPCTRPIASFGKAKYSKQVRLVIVYELPSLITYFQATLRTMSPKTSSSKLHASSLPNMSGGVLARHTGTPLGRSTSVIHVTTTESVFLSR